MFATKSNPVEQIMDQTIQASCHNRSDIEETPVKKSVKNKKFRP